MTAKKMLLLVIQDPEIRAELREMLQDHYYISENDDLHAAMQFLNDGHIPVDAVVLASEDDAAVELMCMLRDNAKFNMTALLLVTRQNVTERELSLLEMGAVDCLQMPFQKTSITLSLNDNFLHNWYLFHLLNLHILNL